MSAAPKNLVLAGSPGVGKTSLIREAAIAFKSRLGGFCTEELREGGRLLGFRIVAFSGETAVLASKAMASEVRLNKYGIDLPALERVGVAALRRAAAESRIVVIDEIGAMEVLSDAFREAAWACLSGPKPVLASIRRGAHEFTDSIERLDRTRLLELTRKNYEEVKTQVREWLEHWCREPEGP